MKYAIRQTYTNNITGRSKTTILKPRWLTRRGAERAAQWNRYRWDGVGDSAATEVIEADQ